jgi:ABC-type branched-subunit amino acid transport system substrate-binding protein
MKRLLIITSVLALGTVATATGAPGATAAPSAVRLCVVGTIAGGPYDWVALATDDGVKLANAQWQGRFRQAGIALRAPLFLNDGVNGNPDPGLAAKTAHSCVKETDVFGYVGPLFSSIAPASMPILNRAGMAQITASATRPSLTSPAFRASLEPLTASRWLSTPTFFRPVPTDAVMNASTLSFLYGRLHARTYYLIRDVDPDGLAFDATVEAYGQTIGMQEVGSATVDPTHPPASVDAIADAIVAKHPDAVVFGSTSGGGVMVPVRLRAKGYTGPVIEGQQLIGNASATGPKWEGFRLDLIDGPQHLLSGIKDLYTVNTGADPSVASPTFRSQYRSRFHRAAPPYSNYAYDAANVLLSSIYGAATHGQLRGSLLAMRSAVTARVARISLHGATGMIAFDRNGDARHPQVGVYRAKAERLEYVGVAPAVSVKATG